MSSSAAMKQYLEQAAEDDIVCAFGPDYFHGARTGACASALFSATLCWYTFRLLKEDQRKVDFFAGLKQGQRNPHFPPWTILRGLRTQPMLTTGCIALATTSALKCIKCYLANQRCREFLLDDIQFDMLNERSETDAAAAAFLASVSLDATGGSAGARGAFSTSAEPLSETQSTQSPVLRRSSPTSTVSDLLHTHSSRLGSKECAFVYRAPTYFDGVAVAFLGSVLDCYLPQKPVQKYYNMRVGIW
nr:unnamed protein product [Leishmania braziliensis]